MLKALLANYGVKEWAFLRSASSPKLESLAVPSLLPVEEEPVKKEDDKATAPSPVRREQCPASRTFWSDAHAKRRNVDEEVEFRHEA